MENPNAFKSEEGLQPRKDRGKEDKYALKVYSKRIIFNCLAVIIFFVLAGAGYRFVAPDIEKQRVSAGVITELSVLYTDANNTQTRVSMVSNDVLESFKSDPTISTYKDFRYYLALGTSTFAVTHEQFKSLKIGDAVKVTYAGFGEIKAVDKLDSLPKATTTPTPTPVVSPTPEPKSVDAK